MTIEKARYWAEHMNELSKADRLWLNNPVIIQGLGIAPLVVAATNGVQALYLSVAVLLMLTPTRVAGAVLRRVFGERSHLLRVLYYAIPAALCYVGIYLLVRQMWGVSALQQLGIYLPLLVCEPLIIRRYRADSAESAGRALRRGLYTTLGYLLVLNGMGLLRELLALGTLYGSPVLSVKLFPLAAQPAGGFILLGVVCAAWRGRIRAFKRNIYQEVERAQ
ncbi:MAG: electron transporter RnfE [Oscillospiraceae bacterium]|nr:electron transporter RnfE [Oscillospiraceae bacterium]